MNLYQLELFTMAADKGSFRSAASELHLSPSALLRQIRALEEDLGLKLFELNGRRMEITREGDVLRDAARNLLMEAERFQRLAVGLKTGVNGKVVIACHGLHVERFFVIATRLFHREHPHIEVQLVEPEATGTYRPFESSDLLANPEIELVMTVRRERVFTSIEMWKVNLATVLSNDHPLRDAKSLTLDDLQEQTIFAYPRGAWSRSRLDELAKASPYPLNIKTEAHKATVLVSARAGFGCAVVADDCLPETMSRPYPLLVGLDQLPVSTTVNLSWLSSKPLSAAAKTFVEFANEHKADIDILVSQSSLLPTSVGELMAKSSFSS